MPFSEKNAAALSRSPLVADLEAEPVAGRGGRLAQHHRMMLMLLAAAQINRLVVAILDMQPDRVFVEFAAGIQVDHVEHDVAAPDDVERRIEICCGTGMCVS